MKIAVEGCCHGELDKIYETIAFLEEREKMKVDVLLCCGDFQAVRNYADLQCMAVPPKYQKLNTFYKYYSGEKKAPILTIFVGGNHEASNYLQELPYGGWVAPNIYYLGYAGVIQIGGVRIGGLSGIYKGRDYNKGHFEKVPYTEDTKRSVYHVRNLEVFRLKQISRPMDIFISHDWPQGIYEHGNKEALLRHKKHFREEVEQRTLGSPAAEELLYKLKPSYWFAAHLHVKFPALVVHQSEGDTVENKQTRFLSLDKCLPKRNFLQVVDIEHNPEKELKIELDPEWLCILKSTNHLLSLRSTSSYMPGLGSNERFDFSVTTEDLTNLSQCSGGSLLYPEKFEPTAPAMNSRETKHNDKEESLKMFINPQTETLCQRFNITHPNAVLLGHFSQDSPAFQNTRGSFIADTGSSNFLPNILNSSGSLGAQRSSDCDTSRIITQPTTTNIIVNDLAEVIHNNREHIAADYCVKRSRLSCCDALQDPQVQGWNPTKLPGNVKRSHRKPTEWSHVA